MEARLAEKRAAELLKILADHDVSEQVYITRLEQWRDRMQADWKKLHGK